MGLFSMFQSKETQSNLDWQRLNEEQQINEIAEVSNDKPCIIFKHSTRCSISSMAYKRFERGWNFNQAHKLFYLDLIQYKPLSSAIAEKFDVEHESPQVLVIRNGKCVFNASHGAITAEIVEENIV